MHKKYWNFGLAHELVQYIPLSTFLVHGVVCKLERCSSEDVEVGRQICKVQVSLVPRSHRRRLTS